MHIFCHLLLLHCASASPLARPPADALYRDPTQPVNARVADLLSRMTLAEKVNQLLSPWPGGAVAVADAATGAAQALTWGSVGGVNGGKSLAWEAAAGREYGATCAGVGCAVS